MSRVVHFEISANDPDKVIAFYKSVFGWEVTLFPGEQPYWLITTGEDSVPGINGGFFKPNEAFSGTVNTIAVESVDKAIQKVTANDGTVVVPKFQIPGIGYQAYCKDVEGTIFGVHQMDGASGQ